MNTAVPELQARNHLCHSPLSTLFSFRTPSQSSLAKKRHPGPSRFSWSKRENGQRRDRHWPNHLPHFHLNPFMRLPFRRTLTRSTLPRRARWTGILPGRALPRRGRRVGHLGLVLGMNLGWPSLVGMSLVWTTAVRMRGVHARSSALRWRRERPESRVGICPVRW